MPRLTVLWHFEFDFASVDIGGYRVSGASVGQVATVRCVYTRDTLFFAALAGSIDMPLISSARVCECMFHAAARLVADAVADTCSGQCRCV